jgi:hypothetical protein
MMTMWFVRACGLKSLVICFDIIFFDIWEKNMAVRSEIMTENIHSLGFQGIREVVTIN